MTVGLISTANARLVAGLGDQNASTFSDPNFTKLGVKRTRLIVPWNAINSASGRSQLDQWMHAARADHLKVLVAFNPAQGSKCPKRPCSIPSAKSYGNALKAFRKRYSFVKEFNFWNETNSATQPTGPTKASVLKKTVALYKAARARNQRRMAQWVSMFLRYAGSRSYPKVWGLHNYGDTNYGRSTGTAFVVNKIAKKGQIWVTETGGIYSFRLQSGQLTFKPNASRQAKATTNAYRVAKKFRRITRLYYYQWRKNNADDFFDAGVIAFSGQLRPAYTSLKRLPKSIWK
jgi:hypothetical protein